MHLPACRVRFADHLRGRYASDKRLAAGVPLPPPLPPPSLSTRGIIEFEPRVFATASRIINRVEELGKYAQRRTMSARNARSIVPSNVRFQHARRS